MTRSDRTRSYNIRGRAFACAFAFVLLTGSCVSLGAAESGSSPGGSSPGAEFDRLMGELSKRKQGHVTFEEKKFIALLDRPVESSGELLYEAPDRLEKRTLKPKPESLFLTGGTVRAQRGRRHYVLDLKQYPQVVPFIESIRATLAGDRQALEKVFNVEFTGHFEQWTLGLAPLDSQLQKKVRQIHIEGEKDRIHTVEIVEADGDRSLLTIGADVAP